MGNRKVGSRGEVCMKGLEVHGNSEWESSNTKTEGEATQIWKNSEFIHKAQIGKPEPKSTGGSPTPSFPVNPRSLSLQYVANNQEVQACVQQWIILQAGWVNVL